MLQLPAASKSRGANVRMVKDGPLKGCPDIAPFNDPVLVLLQKYQMLVQAYDIADEAKAGAKKMAIWKRLQSVADKASRITAQSSEGTAFQIMLISAKANAARDATAAELRDKASDRVERLLYRVLERYGDKANFSDSVREFLMPVGRDPATRRRVRGALR